MLQIAVVHQRERLGVARAEEKNQAAIAPAFHAVFVFDHEAILIFPGEHIGFHAYGKNAELPRRAFHRAPAVIMRFLRHIEIDARPIAGALLVQFAIGVFHRGDAGFHVENLLNLLIGQKNHDALLALVRRGGLEFVFDVPIARCASSVNRKTIRGDALWDE